PLPPSRSPTLFSYTTLFRNLRLQDHGPGIFRDIIPDHSSLKHAPLKIGAFVFVVIVALGDYSMMGAGAPVDNDVSVIFAPEGFHTQQSEFSLLRQFPVQLVNVVKHGGGQYIFSFRCRRDAHGNPGRPVFRHFAKRTTKAAGGQAQKLDHFRSMQQRFRQQVPGVRIRFIHAVKVVVFVNEKAHPLSTSHQQSPILPFNHSGNAPGGSCSSCRNIASPTLRRATIPSLPTSTTLPSPSRTPAR